jgi:hypothetical protein
MGNISINEVQGYLYPVDGSAAFDFVLPYSPSSAGSGGSGGTDGSGSGSGSIPTTGGLGWPLLALLISVGAVLVVRLRRRAG